MNATTRIVGLALGWTFLCGQLQAGDLQAGTGLADITPQEWPLGLVGSFNQRLADAAHDPLHARSLVLSDGETTIAMVVVDNCLINRETLDEAKAIASEKTGIPTEHMLVSATHTHSAPSMHITDEGTPGAAYRKLGIEGIAQSIIDAHAALQGAEAGWGDSLLPDEVFNRRWFLKPGTMPANPFGETTDLVKMNPGSGPHLISPAGPIDPEVSILSVRDAEGKPLCVYANYPLHYVGAVPGGEVSADYFGEFARLIGVRLRRDANSGFLGILSNGTSGDINNINFRDGRPPREPFEQIRIVAGKVADAAYYAYQDTSHRSDLKLDMRERIVPLNVRKPDEDLLKRAEKYLATEGEQEKELPRLAKDYARRIQSLAEGPDVFEVKIQAIRIGDLAICTMPFEVFAEIGLELKSESPFKDTFVVELANGAYGYLPTREQHEFGGYETWLSTNRVQKDASEILVRHLKNMLKELKEAS